MLVTGTVVVDPETVLPEGAVVVADDTIEAVGPADDLAERYPDHERREFDVVAPGVVGAHVHSVQSLGRGIADDRALLEWLEEHVLPMEAGLGAEGVRLAAELGYAECLESGVTTVVDHLTVHHSAAAFEAAIEAGVRARLGKVHMDTNAPERLREDVDRSLRDAEALARRYHGAADGRIRYAVTPRFAVTCTDACLRGCRALADEYEGLRIHTHAAENPAEVATVEERTGRSYVEHLHEVGLTGEDVLLAHCVHTDERERDLLAETGTNVVHCPSSNMKLASGVAPVREYLERGVTVALGNDGPPCNNTLDPYTELRQASLLAKVDAMDPTALPAATVFRMATLAGAGAAGFERVGALRAGWRADLVGIDTDVTRATPVHDVLGHLVFSAHGDDVRFTMVDGEPVYDEAAGGHLTLDAAAVRARAREFDVPGA